MNDDTLLEARSFHFRLIDLLRVEFASPQGARALPRGGSSPARRRLAPPAIPRGAGTDPRRESVLHHRGGPCLGGDGGEPGRGASAILRPVQAGGAGAGGGVEAPDGGPGGPGRGGEPDGSGNSPRRTLGAPDGGGTVRRGADGRRADDRHVEQDARDGVEEVPGTAEEGEGGDSHRKPGASDEEVLTAALLLLIKKQAKRKACVPAKVKREVVKRDQGKCQWTLADGGVCGATVRLEVDHMVPRGRGGPSTVENCRILGRPHNLEAARQA